MSLCFAFFAFASLREVILVAANGRVRLLLWKRGNISGKSVHVRLTMEAFTVIHVESLEERRWYDEGGRNLGFRPNYGG